MFNSPSCRSADANALPIPGKFGIAEITSQPAGNNHALEQNYVALGREARATKRQATVAGCLGTRARRQRNGPKTRGERCSPDPTGGRIAELELYPTLARAMFLRRECLCYLMVCATRIAAASSGLPACGW